MLHRGKLQFNHRSRFQQILRSVQAMGKIGFYNQIETDIKSAADAMGDAMVENLSFLDTQNGIKSFLKKEKPVWTHTDAKDE